MAEGMLGKAMSSDTQPVVVYEVPSVASFATTTINMTNTGTEDAKVKLALGTSSTPGPVDYVEHDAVIPAGGILERSCMLMSPGEKVVVESDKSTVAVRVTGLEQIPTGV